MKVKLHEIARIEAGHPFRGSITEAINGDCQVIQIRNINTDGKVNWNDLVSTQITGRRKPEWLEEGNIIFAARGPKNLATCMPKLDRPIVCAQHFFKITLLDSDNALPDFIAWQLNQKPLQRYFSQSAEGTAQVSIRRAVLENASISLPSLKKQLLITQLSESALKEKQVLTNLINNRQLQINAIAQDVLN